MKNTATHQKHTQLAAALAMLILPGLALAFESKQTDTSAAVKDADREGQIMDTSAAVKDAYREGQIWATYAINPGLNALDLKIDVQGDQATISGTVETPIQKRLAERIANSTDGIASVQNRILVDDDLAVRVIESPPTYATHVADATLEALVNSKLLWNRYTDGLDINVAAAGGVVTLTGIADSPHSRALAGQLAAKTSGTTLVHNNLRLDPDQKGQVVTADADGDSLLSDVWITAKTNSMLQWTEGVHASDITVETKDGVVTLEGTVGGGYERELAIDLVQGVRGVQRVDASGLMIDAKSDQLSQD